ncbi:MULTISPECIES: sugar transferase [Paenibacillus]|nr:MULTISPECIES: sugar transferase [Paenibacillus]
MRDLLTPKRLLDLLVSCTLLLVLSPVIAATAILVRIKLGSPVVFRQQRPGLHGKPFHIYKFRTMTDARDGEGRLLSDELRLTRFGRLLRKYSLDELPQLWNVARGELSLVGPRPLLMEYLPLYNEQQARRHQVKPGITGWSQVNGRNALSWEEKFDLDVWYVDHRSFKLDLRILFMTAGKVFRSEGIQNGNHVTMPVFRGTVLQDEHREQGFQ